MKILTMLILFLVSTGLPGQEKQPLVKPKAQKEKPSGSPQHLLEDLGSSDYATRSAATEALRKLGEKARKVLEQGLMSENVEQRTRARSLLDHLDRKLTESEADPEDPREPRKFERLRRVPRFELDRDADPRGDLERTMRELDRIMRRRERILLRPWDDFRLKFQDLMPRGRSGESVVSILKDGQKLELRRHGDGRVQLKITSTDPKTGIESVKAYEARDLETFKKQYPEIYEKHKDSGLFSQSTGTFSFRFGPLGLDEADEFDEFRGLLPPVPGAPLPSGPKLGIVVAPVPLVLRAHLPIPQSAVIVDEVVPASQAESMGVRLYDVLTHVNGEPVANGAQIRSILTRSDRPATLKLTILRKGKELVLEGEWPRVAREKQRNK